jgi:pimeloyl-ACP methyl ester carboxylesterase
MLALVFGCWNTILANAGIPSKELFFQYQIVNHLSAADERQWSQRYYKSSEFFGGPGSPIFLILGGEGAIEPTTGLAYPFIANHLAKEFSAYVLQPEHRFYGKSQPISPENQTGSTLVTLMTPEQAMLDAVHLLQHFQYHLLGCSVERGDANYCPVITVGGSYPGFLSAMMRVVHPDVVDMAYAASAPMGFYSQTVNQDDYYNLITRVSEKSSTGCVQAVRSTLVHDLYPMFSGIKSPSDIAAVASRLNICPGSVPPYIADGATFYAEIMMVVGYTFANYNMANYPPDESTSLFRACRVFQNSTLDPSARLATFLGEESCFNLSSQLPSGKNASISSGDWSGVGTGNDGSMWDFQTCTLLVEHIGFSEESMFPVRPWKMEWMINHCKARFGVEVQPYELVRRWKFNDLVGAGVTNILFTNGLNDGWSVGGIKTNLSDTLLAINFENGAHHSDLSGQGPSNKDTSDVRLGFAKIKAILQQWLSEIPSNGSLNARPLRGRSQISF